MSYEGKKILLIDDDPTFTRLYTAVFNSEGLSLLIATNGAQGLQEAAIQKPDLILLDIMLPDIDGLDVLKRLKRSPETANITVWMITNLAEHLNEETATSLGATDYLVKASYTPKQVMEKVKDFFENKAPS